MVELRIKKLLRERERAGLDSSLYWLSEQTGIRWATIATWADDGTKRKATKRRVKREVKRLDLRQIDCLCEALGCAPGDLFKRTVRRSV